MMPSRQTIIIGIVIALLASGALMSAEPPAWVADLQSPEVQMRSAAIDDMEAYLKTGRADEVVILALLATGAEKDHVLRMRLSLLYELVPPAAAPIVTRALDNASDPIRAQAAEVLGALGPPSREALPRLLDLLHDPNEEVRSNASFAIGKIDAKAGTTLGALLAMLNSQNVGDRRVAARTLDALNVVAGDRLEDLLDALSDPDETVRYWLVNVLGNLPASKPRVLATLSGLLTVDRSAFVRERAARELWEMAVDHEPEVVESVPALSVALADESTVVRVQAAKGLQAIGAVAKGATPELERCAQSTNHELAQECLKALSLVRTR